MNKSREVVRFFTFLTTLIFIASPADSQTHSDLLEKARDLEWIDHYQEALPVAKSSLEAAKTTDEQIESLQILADIESARGNSKSELAYLLAKEKVLRPIRKKEKEDYFYTLIDIAYNYAANNELNKADSILAFARDFDFGRENRKYLDATEIEFLMDGGQWDEAEEKLNKSSVYYSIDFILLQLRLYNFSGYYEDSENLILDVLSMFDENDKDYQDLFLELLPETLKLLLLDYGLFENEPGLSTIDTLSARALDYLSRQDPFDSILYYSISYDIVTAYMEAGDLDAAENWLYSILLPSGKAKDAPANMQLLDAYVLEAELLEKKGSYIDALWKYEEIDQIAADLYGEESVSYHIYTHYEAIFLVNLGQYDEALAISSKALPVIDSELGKQSDSYASILALVGRIQYLKGNYYESIDLILEAIDINKKNGIECNPCLSNLMVTLAEIFEKAGETRKADSIYRQVFAFVNQSMANPGSDPIVNGYKISMADFYANSLGSEKIKNLDFYNASQITHPNGYTVNFNNPNSQASPIIDVASDLLGQARDFASSHYGENSRMVSIIDLKRAHLNWVLGWRFEAGNLFKTGLDKWLKDINDFFPFMSEGEKSDFYNSASNSFNSYYAFLLDQEISRVGTGFSSNAFYVDPQYRKFYTDKMGGDSINYEIENSVLEGIPKIRFKDIHIGAMLDYRIQTKAILLNSATAIRRRVFESGDSSLVTKYKKWESLNQRMANETEKSVSSLTRSSEDSIGLEIKRLEREISIHSEAFRKDRESRTYSWKDIAARLRPGEAAIEVIRLNSPEFYKTGIPEYRDSIYYAFVIIRGGRPELPGLLLIKNGYELEHQYLSNYQNSMKFQLEDTISFGVYWEPIQKFLQRFTTVYFSPDGVYNLINLQTLKNKNEYLLMRSDVRIVTNLKDLMEEKPPQTGKKAYLFGNPDFGLRTNKPEVRKAGETERSVDMDALFRSGIDPLPGTAREVEAVVKLLRSNGWNHQAFMASTASEENLKNLPQSAELIHLATHGFFLNKKTDHIKENQLLRSGLLLAGAGDSDIENKEDGILTALETMNLDLGSTMLVVLSACETGLGELVDGEGVYGLQRALKIAGARQIVMSLWKVNDQVTMELMRSFYEEYLKSGDANSSLRRSQRKIMEKYPHPYYWGPFVIVGK